MERGMIDWSRIEELRHEIGMDDLAEVLQMFLDEVDEKFAELRNGSSKSPLSDDMHFLKSSALNIGFSDLADICSLAETSALADESAVDLRQVETCYAHSRSELEAHKQVAVA